MSHLLALIVNFVYVFLIQSLAAVFPEIQFLIIYLGGFAAVYLNFLLAKTLKGKKDESSQDS